jgi:hypothetical protein
MRGRGKEEEKKVGRVRESQKELVNYTHACIRASHNPQTDKTKTADQHCNYPGFRQTKKETSRIGKKRPSTTDYTDISHQRLYCQHPLSFPQERRPVVVGSVPEHEVKEPTTSAMSVRWGKEACRIFGEYRVQPIGEALW